MHVEDGWDPSREKRILPAQGRGWAERTPLAALLLEGASLTVP